MKNLKLFAQLLIITSTSFIVGCSPQNIDDAATPKQILSNGQWSVDYYFAGQDKTGLYSHYQFSFVGNGTVTATDGINSISGNWNMLTSVGRNQVLKININSQEPHLQELNEQWSVINSSSNVINMKDGIGELRLKKL